jgi:hypothetical protein
MSIPSNRTAFPDSHGIREESFVVVKGIPDKRSEKPLDKTRFPENHRPEPLMNK